MSALTANCPNCGGPVTFKWSSAIQTTCEFCRSILVRTDVDVRRVGEVADLPLDVSPIQLGTEGTHQGRAFTVAGRIVYEYEQGSWNEWHLVYSDGGSGWLSDAMLQYDLSWLTPITRELPREGLLQRGGQLTLNAVAYTVAGITRAHYKGVQGELPFQYWDKRECVFVDLRNAAGGFATIDYSETPALLFIGRSVEFEELKLRNLREFEGWQ